MTDNKMKLKWSEVKDRMRREGFEFLTNVSNPRGYKDKVQPHSTLEEGLKGTDAEEMITVLRKRGQKVQVDYAFDISGNFIQTMAAIYVTKWSALRKLL